MQRDNEQLRADALRIWQAGVDAVRPAHLIPQFVAIQANTLRIGEEEFDLRTLERLAIVGAGKAGAAMSVALENVLGEKWLREKQVAGWVNVPADCVEPTQVVHLHAARPAGINEPTLDGVMGTEKIIQLVASLGPHDLCICLISGGGSALLPAPIEGFSLDAKIALAREIAARGGNIEQLNTVRRELSRVKGGGLARACQAGQLVSLILSDVLGDDLAMIASGPTVPRVPTPELAIQMLRELQLQNYPAGIAAIELLQGNPKQIANDAKYPRQFTNIVIGNNATAVDAAGIEAEKLGYSHAMISARQSEGPAENVAGRLVEMAQTMRETAGPDCLISGGEPTVTLCDPQMRGVGGRNQQLALAALAKLADWQGLALVAGGTDGEDGPTDAAGALVDEKIAVRARELKLDAQDFLARNDAYHFFENVGGLIKTGPTHTNVCDLRVLTIDR
jgi:glycerate 2-kinase